MSFFQRNAMQAMKVQAVLKEEELAQKGGPGSGRYPKGSTGNQFTGKALEKPRMPVADFHRNVNAIAKHTDNNAHGHALKAGAKMLNQPDLEREASQIIKEHERKGYLTPELGERRRAVYDKLMQHAKENLHPEDYDKFHGAF